jgi:hypothetical protein
MGIRLSAIKIGYLTRHSQVSSSAESLTREPQQMTAPGAEEKLRRDGGCFRFCTPFQTFIRLVSDHSLQPLKTASDSSGRMLMTC